MTGLGGEKERERIAEHQCHLSLLFWPQIGLFCLLGLRQFLLLENLDTKTKCIMPQDNYRMEPN